MRPIRAAGRVWLLVCAAVLATLPLVFARAAAQLAAPKMAPTTIMEKEMAHLRLELNALGAQMQDIRVTTDPGKRRSLLRAHLAQLREAIGSMRAMEARMHEALARGEIAVDRGAPDRHEFVLEHMLLTIELMQQELDGAPLRPR